MESSSVFCKILLPTIMFSLVLLVILILVYLQLPIDQAEKLGSFLSGITSVGLIFISLGSIYATIYVAKSINDLSTETRREDEYSERMIDVLQKMLATDTMLHKALDEDRFDSYRDFDREKTIENLKAQQKSYVLILKYYFSKHPKNFTSLVNSLDSFNKDITDTTKLKQIGSAMFNILSE
jgi:hypothetical protein